MFSSAKSVIQPCQIEELLAYQRKIDEKINTASEAGVKIRLDDLLDDATL